jgi:hypothetical protein
MRGRAEVTRIELLYFDGCPSHERLLPVVRELADVAGAELALHRIDTPDDAEAECFLGSPTVRINGRDVDASTDQRTDYGLKCRLYRSEELGQSPVPPTEWIRAALENARG